MDSTLQHSVLRWWQSMYLSPNELYKKGITPAPNAQKAQLKRCRDLDAVMLTPGFRALWQSLPESITEHATSNDMECWATIAGALVHVKHDSAQNLATAAGSKTKSDKSRVSELRFAQLQDTKTPDEFLRRLRRILHQLDHSVLVSSLAKDIYQWFGEHSQFYPRQADKRITVQWAMDYYRAAGTK